MKILKVVIALAAMTAVVPVSALAADEVPAMPENQQANPAMMHGQQGMMTPEMMQQRQQMMQQMMQQRRQMMQNQPGMMQNQPGMMQNQPGMMQGQPGMMQGQPGMMQQRRRGMQGGGHRGGMMNPEMREKKQAHMKVMEGHLANIEALLRELVEQQKGK